MTVVRWTCPECRRQFGRPHQSHMCEPSLTVDEYFATRPAEQRRVYEAVVAHLEELGPVLVDAVQVGVLFKRSRTFVELRGMHNRLVLSFLLSRVIEHPRITKTLKGSENRAAHFVDVRRAEDIDDDVRGWLTESYLSSPVVG